MALVRAGFDVFSPEVDDKGIDFVLRIDSDPPRYHDVQVKTVRSRSTYVFMKKEKFLLSPNLLLAVINATRQRPLQQPPSPPTFRKRLRVAPQDAPPQSPTTGGG